MGINTWMNEHTDGCKVICFALPHQLPLEAGRWTDCWINGQRDSDWHSVSRERNSRAAESNVNPEGCNHQRTDGHSNGLTFDIIHLSALSLQPCSSWTKKDRNMPISPPFRIFHVHLDTCKNFQNWPRKKGDMTTNVWPTWNPLEATMKITPFSLLLAISKPLKLQKWDCNRIVDLLT